MQLESRALPLRASSSIGTPSNADALPRRSMTSGSGLRVVGGLARTFALCAFVWHLATVSYLPVRHQPFGDDDTEAAVRAMNAGYPFHLLYSTANNSPPILRRMNEGLIDQGVMFLSESWALARQWVTGVRSVITSSIGWDIVFALFVVAAVAIVAPGVPLPVAMAGLVAFQVLLTWGPIQLSLPVHWGVAFSTVLAAVYISTVCKPFTAWRCISLGMLGTLIALAQILRQEAGGVAYGAGLALVVAGAIEALVANRISNTTVSRQELNAVMRRLVAGGLLLIAANVSVVPAQRWYISRQLRTPYAETAAIEHGSGFPLYLSVGYVSNPFNIAWRDPIGYVHARLISPNLAPGYPALQSTLYREYLQVVFSRPWLLLQNVAAKAVRVHRLAVRQAERLPDVAVWQQPAHVRFYEALPFVLAGCFALMWWRGTPEAVAICIASLGLAAAASAGAVIVFPDYIGGVQGAIVVLAVVMPVGVASYILERPSERSTTALARRMIICTGVLALTALVIGSVFVAIQWARYRAFQEQTIARDPLEAIEEQQFRYAHVFNDLPVARQGRLLARLIATDDRRVARVVGLRTGNSDLFRPEALVRTTNQLHVIAWMGASFHAPVPPLYQGTAHSLVFFCVECSAQSTVNDFPFTSTMINDLDWQGRYRMYSIPLTDPLKNAASFQVSAEQVLAVGPQYEPTGILPGLIASAR